MSQYLDLAVELTEKHAAAIRETALQQGEIAGRAMYDPHMPTPSGEGNPLDPIDELRFRHGFRRGWLAAEAEANGGQS